MAIVRLLEHLELFGSRMIEKRILQFAFEGKSLAFVELDLRSGGFKAELEQLANDCVDGAYRARDGKEPLRILVARYHEHDVQRLIARVQSVCGVNFCLHDVYSARSKLKMSGRARTTLGIEVERERMLPVSRVSLFNEVVGGIVSGRITGEGWATQDDCRDRLMNIVNTIRILEPLDDFRRKIITAYYGVIGCEKLENDRIQIIIEFCAASNNPVAFAKSQFLTTILNKMRIKDHSATSASPSPFPCTISVETPHSSPPLPLPNSTSSTLPWLTPYADVIAMNTYRDAGSITQPRVCPPDRCSTKSPIVEKYSRVEEVILELFGWAFNGFALNLLEGDSLYCSFAYEMAEKVRSMDVETEKKRNEFMAVQVEMFQESLRVYESDAKAASVMMHTSFRFMKITLVSFLFSRRVLDTNSLPSADQHQQ